MKGLPRILLMVLVSTASFAQEPISITEFRIEVQHNPGKITEDIIADIYGDSLIVGIVPFQLTDFNLKATFLAEGAETVTSNGVPQESTITLNDLSDPVNYVITSGEESKTYEVRLVYTGLPLVYVYTDDSAPILNREDYVDGVIKIYPNEESATTFSGELEIRGRGNTTWTFPKKPYRIKLGAVASLLGMPSDKDWVLLANYADKSLIRNSLAFDLGSQMNLAYTPRTTHVDLVLNGIYQGNYLLGEHVKADKDRVNIEELGPDDTGEETINGGYFLELDDYRDGNWFELASGLPIVIKSPDEDDITQEQQDYIKSYMQQTEDAILSADFADPDVGYEKYINPETFIEWYWVSEVVKNIDAKDVSSIFYYKDRGEKLNMGPLWDLDVTMGNATVNGGEDPTMFLVRESIWFKRLFEDPAFKSAADARWITFRDELLADLPQMIDNYVARLQLSQQLNFYKWDILDEPVWPSTLVHDSYEKEIAYLKEWMATRIAWIDAQIEQPALEIPFLDLPATNETVASLNPTIKWFSANVGETYDVQVSSSDSFASLVVDKAGVTDTIYSISEQLTEQTTYFWRVRSVKASQQSEWSEVWSFTTPLISGVGESSFGVSLFPNPTSKELFIGIPSLTLIDNATLVDVLGRTATRSVLAPGTTTRIDVSNLQRGMYVVILSGSIDKPVTWKVVLR